MKARKWEDGKTRLNCPAEGCRRERVKKWHLACVSCWNRLPAELQERVYEEFKRKQGSFQHFEAITDCMRWWRANPEAKQEGLFG